MVKGLDHYYCTRGRAKSAEYGLLIVLVTGGALMLSQVGGPAPAPDQQPIVVAANAEMNLAR